MYQLTRIRDTISAEVEVKDPETGAPLGVFITLAGPEHPKRKAQDFARQRKIRAHFAKTGKMQLADPEEEAQDNIEALISATLGWRGVIDDAGKEVPFTPDAVSKLYSTDDMGWLRAQLLTAMGERERFIKRSATV